MDIGGQLECGGEARAAMRGDLGLVRVEAERVDQRWVYCRSHGDQRVMLFPQAYNRTSHATSGYDRQRKGDVNRVVHWP